MRKTRLLFEIVLLALAAFCLLQCGQGIVEACSDDFDCTEEPNLHCDLAVHRCIARPCTPDCSARECGPDPQNCGTSCGTCALMNQDCNPTTGRCESCSPDCGARVCGPVPNGCGESCGSCEDPKSCNIAGGQCEGCTPDCGARVCGGVPNGCGESCGSCKDPKSCNIASGQCEGCTPDCGARVCGPVPNGCGETCGACQDSESCDTTNGRCEGSESGKLLWDGSFHGNERRIDRNTFQSDGQYSTYACLAQSNSFAVVKDVGGRTGYAGKFTSGVGSGYDCNSNQHNIIFTIDPRIPVPGSNREYWYGWSMMLDPSWKPANPATNPVGSGVFSIGLSMTSHFFTLGGKGLGFQMNNRSDNSIYLQQNGVAYALPDPNLQVGKWYDFMFHMKWKQDNSGFLEVYRRKPGQSGYESIFSKYNYQTEYPFVPEEQNYFEARVGMYRSSNSVTEQTVLVMNPKIGTTRASVEYGSSPANPGEPAP